nr:hypothetical protein 2 [Bacillales bacterium]
MADEINEILAASGAYRKWALEARKRYIELRLKQDPEIRSLYIRSVDRIAKEIRYLDQRLASTSMQKRHLEQLENQLRLESNRFTDEFTSSMRGYVDDAVQMGSGYSRSILLNAIKEAELDMSGIDGMCVRVNKRAAEAIWSRTIKGLYLSDRIWRTGQNLRQTMRDIIQESVVLGQNATKTARLLEQYVRTDSRTISENYPNMMERIKGRVPSDLSYEALRIARTETTAAFGEGTILGSRVSPSYEGVKWILSRSHPEYDICDELAGIYDPEEEPSYPAHPNCLCILVPIHTQPEEFGTKLQRWKVNPSSEPKIEEWYQNIYRQEVA